MPHNKVEKELKQGHDLSIIKLVDNLVEFAFESRVSDIHIEPTEKSLRVRFRVDGVLQDVFTFPKEIKFEVVSRIKVLAGLRTDEHQSAQDGRFSINFENGTPIDVRVSITPTYYGGNAVLRLLSDKAEEFTLAKMGFNKSDQEKINRVIKKTYGMILATRPTGSGKTTTLYTLLKALTLNQLSKQIKNRPEAVFDLWRPTTIYW